MSDLTIHNRSHNEIEREQLFLRLMNTFRGALNNSITGLFWQHFLPLRQLQLNFLVVLCGV